MISRVVALACALSFLSPASGFAGAPKCRANDPAAASDAAAVQAVRAAIDTTCPCANFPANGKKSLHGKYVACAKGVVKSALDADQLRTQCKNLAVYRAALSTCGYPIDPTLTPCLKQTKKGPVCKISKLAKCTSPKLLPCAVHGNCLAAADTNHDGQVSGLDDGQCNPLQDCGTVTPTQTQVDGAVIECFDSCTNPLNLQECIIGCSAGGDNPAARAAFTAVCEADPTFSCDDLHTAYLAACASVPAPAQQCTDNCFGDPFCTSKCDEAGNCPRYAGFAYDNCVAQAGN